MKINRDSEQKNNGAFCSIVMTDELVFQEFS